MITRFDDRPRVIARGWGGEPAVLRLYCVDKTTSYVGNGVSEKSIGLPHGDVFAWCESRQGELMEAFSCRDFHKLSSIYASISLDDLACNKYRNKVSSDHGQESIAGSEPTSYGDGQREDRC